MNSLKKFVCFVSLGFLVFIIDMALSVGVNAQEAVTEVSKIRLRTWDIYAFLWLLFAYRANNTMKRQKWYPEFMCKWKTAKDGKHQYKKIKARYLRIGSVFLFTVGVYYCWQNLIGIRFDDLKQVLIASVIVGLSAQKIIDIVMAKLEKKYPDVHEVLVDGLYKEQDDMTVLDKTMIALVTGGGKDTRKVEREEDEDDPTRVMTDTEIGNVTGKFDTEDKTPTPKP